MTLPRCWRADECERARHSMLGGTHVSGVRVPAKNHDLRLGLRTQRTDKARVSVRCRLVRDDAELGGSSSTKRRTDTAECPPRGSGTSPSTVGSPHAREPIAVLPVDARRALVLVAAVVCDDNTRYERFLSDFIDVIMNRYWNARTGVLAAGRRSASSPRTLRLHCWSRAVVTAARNQYELRQGFARHPRPEYGIRDELPARAAGQHSSLSWSTPLTPPPPRSCACGTRPHRAVCARVPNRPHASAGRASRCLASGPRGRRESDMELAREETLSPRPRIKRIPGGDRHVVLPLRPGPRHYSRGSSSRSSRKRSARAPAGTCPRRIRTAISRRRSRFGLDIRPPGKPRTARPDRPTMTCVRALLPGFVRARARSRVATAAHGPRHPSLPHPRSSPSTLLPNHPLPHGTCSPPIRFPAHPASPSTFVVRPHPCPHRNPSCQTPFDRARPTAVRRPLVRHSLRSRPAIARRSVGSARRFFRLPSLRFASLRFASLRQLPSALMNGTKGAEATGGYIGNEKRFTGGFQVRVM